MPCPTLQPISTTIASATTLTAALLLGAGCGVARQQHTTPTQPGPVRIAPGAAVAPPWLEAAAPRLGHPDFGTPIPRSFGATLAMYQTDLGVFLVSRDRARGGVQQRVTLPPRTTWASLDDRDHLWLAIDGTLHVASNPLQPARTLRAVSVPATLKKSRVAWDVNRGLVVGAAGDVVHVSEDRGATWHATKPLPRLPAGATLALHAVFARADGVIVAVGRARATGGVQRVVLVSRDRGKAWALAQFQPAGVRRDGGWIWNGDLSCPATLATDGVTWSSEPHLQKNPAFGDRRGKMLSLGGGRRAFASPGTGTFKSAPPAPDPKRRHVGARKACQDPIIAPGARAVAKQTRGLLPAPCRGAMCLRGTTDAAPPTTRSWFALLGDGVCAAEHAALDGRCVEGAPLTRAPHAALVDRASRAAHVFALPAQCDPERLWSARGLGVLACREGDATAVFTTTPAQARRGRWTREGILKTRADRLDAVSMREDGTLVLHGRCPPVPRDAKTPPLPCAASWLRATRAGGARWSWTKLSRRGLLTARPLPGGRALLVTASPRKPDQMTLWIVTPGTTKTTTRRLITARDLQEKPARGLEVRAGMVRVRLGDELRPPASLLWTTGALRDEAASRPSE